ncbi:hypothetical protein C8J56DRAFT_441253 [Mycena floridula]|nr:hypothetical protein C8J56DRAFT_441253 [Mycena floridula]
MSFHRSSQQYSLPPISQIFNIQNGRDSSLSLPPMRGPTTGPGHPGTQGHWPQSSTHPAVYQPAPIGYQDPRHYGPNGSTSGHSVRSREQHHLPPNTFLPQLPSHSNEHRYAPNAGTNNGYPYAGPGSAPRYSNGFPSQPLDQQGNQGRPGRTDQYPNQPHESREPEDQGSNSKTCHYCGKGFLRPSALKIHLISHTGDKDFVCPDERCGRRFGVRSNMLRHIRLVHQNLQHVVSEELDARDWRG